MIRSRAAVLALLLAGLTPAPLAAQAGRYPVSGPQRLASPEIAADGRVTFRLHAPEARAVSVEGNWEGKKSLALTRGENGVWSAATPPLAPDLYNYAFRVDGLRVLDPGNVESQRGGNQLSSLLMVSGPAARDWDMADVPHGSVEQVWAPAPVLHQPARRMAVYLPPDYHARPARRYPVLYLLHGGGGDEESWLTQGRAAQILDNLIAAGRMAPMIVVMPNGEDGQSRARGSALGPTPSRIQAEQAPGSDARFAVEQPQLPEPYAGHFPESLVRDIVPFVERTYRTAPGAANRAVAGLSMGGAQTVVASASNPGLFGWIGVFSAGGMVGDPAFERQLGQLVAARPRLYWVGAGDADIARLRAAALYKRAKGRGLPATFLQVPGGHTWFVWRRFLVDFGARLFRPEGR
ncbi:hypothetical protein H7F51_15060 [Novosphingobium flavum]|uniref:Glycoside hydrolase family 13 N-terminal domain-containing protein n=1 Tax=Novosphingobium flavum TaxID=1778672 RepID=A0A7X1KMN7_9SPHN|nr:alpha/beta hydrolase-fold protein [Novosphingobium flavum]MBC2666836.1 hypothetical protein [Novosphingobium flavum]